MEQFLRACHDAVKDAEPKRLASQMGLPHVSLLQRANPDNDAHKLTINHLYQTAWRACRDPPGLPAPRRPSARPTVITSPASCVRVC